MGTVTVFMTKIKMQQKYTTGVQSNVVTYPKGPHSKETEKLMILMIS